MFTRKLTRTVLGHQVWIAALLLLVPEVATAQIDPGRGQMMKDKPMIDAPMDHPHAPTPFYREQTFLILVGIGIGEAGYFAYRIGRSRWRRRHGPGGFTAEAVLVVDLVGSTHLAKHYRKGLAMRATAHLHDRTLALAEPRGLTFSKSTGDGCFLTFPTVSAACTTTIALLRDISVQTADHFPAPGLELRAGISYGEILMNGGNDRFGTAINKAFRLEGLSKENFASVEGESSKVRVIAERNRIFLDEEAVHELQSGRNHGVPLRFLGFAKLKGFAGLHRVDEAIWSEAEPPSCEPEEEDGR